jgi:hypothetical protein
MIYEKVIEVRDGIPLIIGISNLLASIALTLYSLLSNANFLFGLLLGLNIYSSLNLLCIYYSKENRKVFYKKVSEGK